MKKQQGNHAFIDSKNLNLSVRSQGWRLDWLKFRYLESKNKLLKILVPTSRYSDLLREFNNKNYIIRIDLLRNLPEQKKTGIRGRSKP